MLTKKKCAALPFLFLYKEKIAALLIKLHKRTVGCCHPAFGYFCTGYPIFKCLESSEVGISLTPSHPLFLHLNFPYTFSFSLCFISTISCFPLFKLIHISAVFPPSLFPYFLSFTSLLTNSSSSRCDKTFQFPNFRALSLVNVSCSSSRQAHWWQMWP